MVVVVKNGILIKEVTEKMTLMIKWWIKMWPTPAYIAEPKFWD